MVTCLFVIFYQELGKILLVYKHVCTQMFDLKYEESHCKGSRRKEIFKHVMLDWRCEYEYSSYIKQAISLSDAYWRITKDLPQSNTNVSNF